MFSGKVSQRVIYVEERIQGSSTSRKEFRGHLHLGKRESIREAKCTFNNPFQN